MEHAPSKNQNVPHGRPAVLYNMPINFGTYDHLYLVSQNELLDCATLFATESYVLDNDYFQLCDKFYARARLDKTCRYIS